MKFSEFCVEIQRTLPDLNKMYPMVGRDMFPGDFLNIIHMRLGMITEIGELYVGCVSTKDDINMAEEVGDILWYVGNDLNLRTRTNNPVRIAAAELLKYEFTNTYQPSDGGEMFGVLKLERDVHNVHYGAFVWLGCIQYNAIELADFAKKALAYSNFNKEKEGYAKRMKYLLSGINNFCLELNVNPGEAMEAVVLKLKKRYKDKFTETEANNRDLQQERQVLEDNIRARPLMPTEVSPLPPSSDQPSASLDS